MSLTVVAASRQACPSRRGAGITPAGTGLLLCITIIGIPFGIASFKLAGLSLAPFGKTVVKAGQPLPVNCRVYLAV